MSSVETTGEENVLQEPQSPMTDEEILQDISESTTEEEKPFGFFDYLAASINLDVPKEVLVKICIDRDIDVEAEIQEIDKKERDLCIADLYVWACMGQGRRGTVSDTDNGWTHSDGGFSLTSEDKRLLLKKANAIYAEYEEPLAGTTKMRIQSRGIRKADILPGGDYRERHNPFL